MGPIYFVFIGKYILCSWGNIFCVHWEIYFVFSGKYILYSWGNIFCVHWSVFTEPKEAKDSLVKGKKKYQQIAVEETNMLF